MIAQAISWPFLSPLSHTNATSASAQDLAELLRDVTEHQRRKASDWRPDVRARIEEIAVECSVRDWDNYGAQRISEVTKHNAQAFVDLLPPDLPEPQAAADPDGEISLYWDFGPDRMFTASIGESGAISYAGILGKGVKRHGQEPFRGDVAKILVDSVREVSRPR